MQFKEICELLVEIEAEFDVAEIRIDGICIWPLVRQTLWFALSQKDIPSRVKVTGINKLKLFARKAVTLPLVLWRAAQCPHSKTLNQVDIVFFTRKVYLQSVGGATLYDRIVDPLIFLTQEKSNVKKLYVGGVGNDKNLAYQSEGLFEDKFLRVKELPQEISIVISKIAMFSGLEPSALTKKLLSNYQLFCRWRKTGKKLFSDAPLLKTVYVTSWYFPDMMGLISAAKSHGIQVIDIQHGQQGQYQGMYSWWSKVPANGYAMMPSKFWCWGQNSVNHIMNSSHANLRSMLFVGGYAWMDFYQSQLRRGVEEKKEKLATNKVILFTLQAPDGDHKEPIPDFILSFLSSKMSNQVTFIFRCHPNYHGCGDYISEKLKNIDEKKYIVSMGLTPLYDDLLIASHHLTACSTCCYEADAFGIPTMLFGHDALKIYQEEIKNRTFMWTDGRLEDMAIWLNLGQNELPKSNYISTSLEVAEQALITNSLNKRGGV